MEFGRKMKPVLTIEKLKKAAKAFCELESTIQNKELYRKSNGKAIGTYVEKKFHSYLKDRYIYEKGSSSKGIDIPEEHLITDIKVTSKVKPQSSCPFTSAEQKIFGLGYNLLIFVYDKVDDDDTATSKLSFEDCTFLDKEKTADYETTSQLRKMLKAGTTKDDIVAYLHDKKIPTDEQEFTLNAIADRVLNETPQQGHLTVSNALQWRLHYSQVVKAGNDIEGITKIVDKVE